MKKLFFTIVILSGLLALATAEDDICISSCYTKANESKKKSGAKSDYLLDLNNCIASCNAAYPAE